MEFGERYCHRSSEGGIDKVFNKLTRLCGYAAMVFSE